MGKERPNKVARELAAIGDHLGFVMEKTAKGHYRFAHPSGGAVVFGAGTPGDWRNYANVAAKLRRVLRDRREAEHGPA